MPSGGVQSYHGTPRHSLELSRRSQEILRTVHEADEPRAPSGAMQDGASPRVSLEMRPRVSFQGDVSPPRRSLEVMRHSQEVLRRVGEGGEARVYPANSAVEEPVELEMRPRVSFHGVTGLVGFAPE